MKKSVFIILILLLAAIPALRAQNRSIRFIEKPFEELLSMAKEQNKLVFLDAYTTWCGPCKWMAANMFTRDSVADYYNATFICAHFDMEKGQGLDLAKAFQVRAYPTLLFINGKGEMVHMRVGAPQKVRDYLEMAHEALTPGEGFAACAKAFQEGNRNPAFLVKYFDRLEKAYIPVSGPFNQYVETLSDKDLLTRENWNLLYRYLSDIDSKGFAFMVSHRKEYEKIATKDSVESKLFNVCYQSLNNASRNRNFNEKTYNEAREKVRNSGYDGAGKVILASDLNICQMKGETDKFIQLALDGTDKYLLNDSEILNKIAWAFFQMTADQPKLEKAAEWAKRSIALKSIPENNDTYANLAFKLGKTKEAVKYEQLAIDLAKKNNLPTKEYEDSLKKFEGK